jgi:NADH:ubiquinone oxidoreductase subunit E
MAKLQIPVRLAPEYLDQPILPGWQFSLFSVDLGGSSDPEIEKAAIERIGSYGKQIGHLAEALEVVINELGLLEKPMTQERHDALQIFMGDVAEVRKLKPPPTKS